MNQRLLDKSIIFGVPIGLMLLCSFIVLAMQFGRPFCLSCFTDGFWHSNNIIPFLFGYGFVVLVLHGITYNGLFGVGKPSDRSEKQ